MPALQNLVLTDRATPTPVNHTFTPREISQGVGTVEESSGGVPAGSNKVSVSSRRLPSGKYKAEVRLIVPILVDEVINGVSVKKVARTSYASATFTFESTSTEVERSNVVGMFADSFGVSKTLVHDTVVKLQGVWG